MINLLVICKGKYCIHASYVEGKVTTHLREFEAFITSIRGPTFFEGDFNCVFHSHERRGGNGQLHPESMEFLEIVNMNGMIKLGYSGTDFTWSKGRTSSCLISKRLDRVITNAEGIMAWPAARVAHLANFFSDHCPLMLSVDPKLDLDKSRWPFRFEAAWLQHQTFRPLMQEKWREVLDTPDALKFLQ
ncbi:hypothetical protein V2J09_001026 [Rumex salicifolius]